MKIQESNINYGCFVTKPNPTQVADFLRTYLDKNFEPKKIQYPKGFRYEYVYSLIYIIDVYALNQTGNPDDFFALLPNYNFERLDIKKYRVTKR